jgi:hypothetical protein
MRQTANLSKTILGFTAGRFGIMLAPDDVFQAALAHANYAVMRQPRDVEECRRAVGRLRELGHPPTAEWLDANLPELSTPPGSISAKLAEYWDAHPSPST